LLLQLQYLFDRQRTGVEPVPMYAYLQATFGVGLCSYAFPAIVLEALRCGRTNDPFDRLIVAHAIANYGAALVTADTVIRKHYAGAVW
jgi:hypothetical protein